MTQREYDLRRLVGMVGLRLAALIYEDDPWLIFRLDRKLAENLNSVDGCSVTRYNLGHRRSNPDGRR